MANFWIKALGPSIIHTVLKNGKPEEMGVKVAKALDEALDEMFGAVKSERVQSAVLPFLDEFMIAFRKELLGDQS